MGVVVPQNRKVPRGALNKPSPSSYIGLPHLAQHSTCSMAQVSLRVVCLEKKYSLLAPTTLLLLSACSSTERMLSQPSISEGLLKVLIDPSQSMLSQSWARVTPSRAHEIARSTCALDAAEMVGSSLVTSKQKERKKNEENFHSPRPSLFLFLRATTRDSKGVATPNGWAARNSKNILNLPTSATHHPCTDQLPPLCSQKNYGAA